MNLCAVRWAANYNSYGAKCNIAPHHRITSHHPPAPGVQEVQQEVQYKRYYGATCNVASYVFVIPNFSKVRMVVCGFGLGRCNHILFPGDIESLNNMCSMYQ